MRLEGTAEISHGVIKRAEPQAYAKSERRWSQLQEAKQFGLKGGTSGESKDHRWPHDLGKGLSPRRKIIN